MVKDLWRLHVNGSQRSEYFIVSLLFNFYTPSFLDDCRSLPVLNHIERFDNSIEAVVCVQGGCILNSVPTIKLKISFNGLGDLVSTGFPNYVILRVKLFPTELASVNFLYD